MQCLAQLVQHVQIICNTSIAKVYSVLIVLCSDLAVFIMFQYFKLFRLLQVGKVSSLTPSPLEKVLCFSYAKLRHTYFLDFHVKILPDKKKRGGVKPDPTKKTIFTPGEVTVCERSNSIKFVEIQTPLRDAKQGKAG